VNIVVSITGVEVLLVVVDEEELEELVPPSTVVILVGALVGVDAVDVALEDDPQAVSTKISKGNSIFFFT
jgi:hypothetical protein